MTLRELIALLPSGSVARMRVAENGRPSFSDLHGVMPVVTRVFRDLGLCPPRIAMRESAYRFPTCDCSSCKRARSAKIASAPENGGAAEVPTRSATEPT